MPPGRARQHRAKGPLGFPTNAGKRRAEDRAEGEVGRGERALCEGPRVWKERRKGYERDERTAAIGKSRKSETNGRVCRGRREGRGRGEREIKKWKRIKRKKNGDAERKRDEGGGKRKGRTLDGDDRDGYIYDSSLLLSRPGPKARGAGEGKEGLYKGRNRASPRKPRSSH